MKRTVYKYPLVLTDQNVSILPQGATILKVAAQGFTLQLWALVDLEEKREEHRVIRIVGTGHPVEGEVIYINTFTTHGEQFVWHAFEEVG